MSEPFKILQMATLPEKTDRELKQSFDVVVMPKDEAEHHAFLDRYGSSIRGICVRHAHIDKLMLDKMPALEIISSYSAGLEGIDTVSAEARGIVIRNTSAILAEDVADLAIVLTIAVTRGTIRGHDFVRDNRWPTETFPLGRSLRSLKTGIVGLGHIGAAVARRLQVMGAPIAYYGPRKKPVEFAYFDTVEALADWADLLIVTCPATPETVGLISASVLERLGRQSFLVNISRGTVVDEQALISILARDGLAGAALDVFEQEPEVPEELRRDHRVVLSPHMGSGTLETRQQMGDRMVEALHEHFDAASASNG